MIEEFFTFCLFVYPNFLCTTCLLCDCLYGEKDVGGGLRHDHISHLVHPERLILGRIEHPKNDGKIL